MGQCIAKVKCFRLGSYSKMSVWSWKKNGWLDCAFATLLIFAIIVSSTSIAFRKSFTTSISFNGGSFPEVGVFNLFLYMSSFLGMVCVILRYVYIADKNVVVSNVSLLLNKLSLLPGISSFAGLLIIAAFPFNSKQRGGSLQTVGAYIFFTSGILFSLMQTVTTFMYSRFSKIFFARIVLVIIVAGCFIAAVIMFEKNQNQKLDPSTNNTLGNETSIPTFTETKQMNAQILAFGFERACVFVYALFFLTFFIEFQTLSTYIILRPLVMSSPSDYTSSATVNERL
ncbi:DNA damage-regulated autophagy modulator protein 1-like [Argiope bruennichi]|uniref:DNA damage-regulated autophagy modulator protein 1-like n=1 Tax=Argiope bruennichi TaxID=94029 RepID=UPI002494CE47|nr:DNA damage-regulated autophagy modulator protein 1-like [Argiope bruennichi]